MHAENYMRPRGSSFSRRGREPISPGKGGSFSNDSFSGTRNYAGGSKELSRNMSNKGFSNKGDDFVGAGEIVNDHLWNQARDKEIQQLNSWEKPRIAPNLETGGRNPHSVVLSESISRVVSENSPSPASTGVTQSTAKINESEKIWHYKDPSGKIQGPFSMVQLRKWSNTGYFPANLRIWRSNEKQDDAILLTDALNGKFHKDPPVVDISLSQTVLYSGKPHDAPLQQGMEAQVGGNSDFDQNRTAWNVHGALGSSGQSVGGNWKLQPEISSASGAVPSLEIPKQYREGWGSETNLPSPTPAQSTAVEARGKTFEKEWSPTPIKQSSSLMTANLFPGGNAGKQSPTVIVSESSQLTHFSTPPSSTSALRSNVDGLNVAHGVISASKTETGESHRMLVSPHQLPSSDSVVASMNPGVDIKNISASLQGLVQPVSTHITPIETHGWGSGLAARPETIDPSPKPGSGSQVWGNASSQNLEPNNPASLPAQSPAYGQPYASSFSTGNSSGVFPASGQSGMPSSDSWRPPVPSQSNVQPPAQPIAPWAMGASGNQSVVPRQGPENQSTGWGPMPGNPSMAWGGQLPATTNMNWGGPVQGQTPGNANSGWVAPGQGQAPKNAIPGWVPSGQGPAPVNANPGWVASGQGPPSGNANPGWAAPTGNPGMWGGEQNNSGDRFMSQRDRGSQGGDSGYGGGGGRPWNRQPSFGNRGGDSSRPPYNKGQRVCKFHESGHCKKGSQCDYLHT